MRMRHPDVPIPPALQHRPRFNGYIVPWFVESKKDFTQMSNVKWVKAVKEQRCFICGGINRTGKHAFLTGPKGRDARTGTDAPSHVDCAKYAVQVCPFILFSGKQRKYEDNHYSNDPLQDNNNPNEFWMTIVSHYTFRLTPSNSPVLTWEVEDIIEQFKVDRKS